MNNKREVVVLSGVRTAIGGYGGSLKDSPPSELAALCVREAVSRSGVEPGEVGHVVFGNIIHTDAHDHYLARVAGVKGGLPVETPALTLNRLCGSGMQAIVSASQYILLGDTDAAVAGGAESMSRGAYASVRSTNCAPTSGERAVRLRWSLISTGWPICMSGRSPPAALVSTTMRAPAAQAVRTGCTTWAKSCPS